MPPAPLPADETARLLALHACAVLDTEAEDLFDDLTRLAARLGEVPIALVSLVDEHRQWFKSTVGLGEVTETPRDWAFCAYAILQHETLIITDAAKDPRTYDNPLVTDEPNIRFYAGAPLRTQGGYPLGTLCLIDTTPRDLTATQRQDLEAMARQVSALLELRKNSGELEELGRALSVRNAALEEMARKAELASVVKSEFLANMSHEIRTPMNAVIGLTERLLETSLDELQRDYLRTVLDSAESLLEIINDVLDFSKIEAGKLQLEARPFSLDDVLGDALRALGPKAHEHGLELAYRAAPNVPDALIGDRGRLRQIFINLAGNAIKFTERGHCLVEAEVAEEPTPPAGRATLRFRVSDTGVGIAAEKLETIFGVFEQADASTTRRYGGAGLGLAITKRLVEQMGGQIEVASQVGRGSVFTFTACFEVDRERAQDATMETDLTSHRILIVARHTETRQIIAEMVAARRIETAVAASGREAFQKTAAAEKRGDPFSLFIVDNGLADISGVDLVRQLRESSADETPLILLSSLDDLGQSDQIARLRQCKPLMKPVKERELFQALRQLLHASDERPAPGTRQVELQEAHLSEAELPIMRILLAEDSAANQKLALALLEQAGHEVTVANNGREALDYWAATSFDVILMDIQMPEIDGYEATRAIRQAEASGDRRLPIIAMTAHALAGDRERCLEAGMDAYVAKPIRLDLLNEALAVAWARRSPRHSADDPVAAEHGQF